MLCVSLSLNKRTSPSHLRSLISSPSKYVARTNHRLNHHKIFSSILMLRTSLAFRLCSFWMWLVKLHTAMNFVFDNKRTDEQRILNRISQSFPEFNFPLISP
jgi:hypothetical protein